MQALWSTRPLRLAEMVLRHLARGLMRTRKRAPPPMPAQAPRRAVPSPLHGTCFYGHQFREIDSGLSGWGRTRQCVRCELCWSLTPPADSGRAARASRRLATPPRPIRTAGT